MSATPQTGAAGHRGKRLKLLAAALGGAAILVVALVVISQSGSDGKRAGPPRASDLAAAAADVNRSLRGIPQRGSALGDPKAPVTLIEFADMQCPYCAYVATQGALPKVIDRYVRSGKVKMELHLLSFLGPDSQRAAAVAAATASQGRLWQFAELSFLTQGVENSGYVTDSYLRSITSRIRGLDAGRALSDAEGAKARARVAGWTRDGQVLNVNSTPSFFLQRGDGQPEQIEVQLDDVGSFSRPIDSALAG